jgi:4-hydroxyphenylpyruvate dioxygenase
VTHSTGTTLLDGSAVELPQPPAPPHLLGFDHIHWWVGNARHTAYFLARGFGFRPVAYAGPETGVRDRQSYVLDAGRARFVVSAPLQPGGEMAEHIRTHGDGVHDVAYRVDDAHTAWKAAVRRGGVPYEAPVEEDSAEGSTVTGSIRAYGDTIHTLVERTHYRGCFLPGYQPIEVPTANVAGLLDEAGTGRDGGAGLIGFDHVVANVEDHRLDQWVNWYETVWGMARLQHFSQDAISSQYSALRSTVVWDGSEVVQPINEPAPGRRKSQIEEFLDYYRGPGVQHVALKTSDIVATVSELTRRGIRFLRVPDEYYDQAPHRLGALGKGLPWARLKQLGILVDGDSGGCLLQVFTENVASRPTVFLEVIERRGARGFGEGNFKALFSAIEVEQARRGNL